jgi:hypothetical protein
MKNEIQTEVESENQNQMRIELQKESVTEMETETEVIFDVNNSYEIREKLYKNEEPLHCYYFCIFCRENTYFNDKRIAVDHYKQHLTEVLKCKKCFSTFVDMKAFKSHNREHSKDVQNLINVHNYYLSLDWIKSFLSFQSTDKFKQLTRISRDYCPVCYVIKTNYRLFLDNSNDSQSICDIFNLYSIIEESFVDHIREHLNCKQVFECIECKSSTSTDGKESKFFFELTEAQNHLLRSHACHKYNSINISEICLTNYFSISQLLSPKLQSFIEKLTKSSDFIKELVESSSID